MFQIHVFFNYFHFFFWKKVTINGKMLMFKIPLFFVFFLKEVSNNIPWKTIYPKEWHFWKKVKKTTTHIKININKLFSKFHFFFTLFPFFRLLFFRKSCFERQTTIYGEKKKAFLEPFLLDFLTKYLMKTYKPEKKMSFEKNKKKLQILQKAKSNKIFLLLTLL